MRQLIEHLQYRFDDLFSRGPWGKFVLLLAFTVCVVLFGTLAALLGLFAPGNAQVEGIRRDQGAGFWDALWWSVSHVFDPSFFAANYGATAGVVAMSAVVSVLGMVIFGALIGFISTGIESRLEALRRGNSPVKETGHALVLGWSTQAHAVIETLAAGGRRPRVVVLAPRDVAEMQDELRARGAYALGAKIVLRSGSPASPIELARVAAAQARSIVVLSTPSRGDAASADIDAVKTLLALARFPFGERRPRIACEIARPRGVDIARAASRGTIPLVSSGEVASRLLFQASLQSGVAAIWDALIAGTGPGFVFKEIPRAVGMRYGDLAHAFPTATLVGITTPAKSADGSTRFEFVLNPPRTRPVAQGEWLVFLSRSEAIADRLDQPAFASSVAMPKAFLLLPTDGQSGGTAEAPGVYVSEVSRSEKHYAPPRQRLLVLGWNANVHDLLAEHDAAAASETEVLVVSALEETAARAALAAAGRSIRRLKLTFRTADSLARGVMTSLAPSGYDAVAVLADESHQEADADARTVMTLVLLQEAMRGAKARPRIVAELLDGANAGVIADLRVDDLVVTPRVVSQMLVQVAHQALLADIYRELLSSGGVEIYLKPIPRYIVPGRAATFNDLVYSALRQGETALGVRLAAARGAAPAGLHLDPPKDARWEFGEGDMAIVLAEELYDRK